MQDDETSGGTAGKRPPSMAETLLKFAEPLFRQADENTSREELQSALQLVVTIWNAVCVDGWGKGTHHLADVQAAMTGAGAAPEVQAVFEEFVTRKRELFADDLRAISSFELTQDGAGSFQVVAEGRLPADLE